MLNNSIKATIKKFEDGHREMWIEDCPIWGFKDIFNVHDILNKETMIKCLTEDYPKGNNNMCFLQEEYPEISDSKNRIKTKESAKILNLKYDESTEYFYGDIASTNQNFIDCVELMKRLPRIHPAYLGTNNQIVNDIINTLLDADSWRAKTVTNFDELLFWLAEFDLSHIPLDIEEVEDSETPTPKNDDECHPHPFTNLKSLNPVPDIGRDEIKRAINTVLNRFADKIISEDGGACSYERLSEDHVVFEGPKIDFWVKDNTDKIDIYALVNNIPIISVTSDGYTIIMDNSRVDEIKALRYPSFGSWAKTLYDMLVEERRIGWTSREDTLKERLEKSEESDDKEDISNLIPKEELAKTINSPRVPTTDEPPLPKDDVYKAILKNIQPVLHDSISDDGENGWNYGERFHIFYWRIHNLKAMLQIGASLMFEVEKMCWVWEIHTHNPSNVNVKVYADRVELRDENCSDYDDFSIYFMRKIRDDLAERLDEYNREYCNKSKSDTNNEKTALWETMRGDKTMTKEELPAFSQALIVDNKRPSKTDYYLAMAEVASTRGTCLRRRYGSVIVKDDRIVATGYVGAPAGRKNCCDIGYCRREKLNAPRGTMYHLCRSIHSEQNAIINASKEEMLGATLYLTGVNIADGSIVKNADCCSMCKRFIINSGISRVIIKDPTKPEGHRTIDVSEWVSDDDSLDAEVGY